MSEYFQIYLTEQPWERENSLLYGCVEGPTQHQHIQYEKAIRDGATFYTPLPSFQDKSLNNCCNKMSKRWRPPYETCLSVALSSCVSHVSEPERGLFLCVLDQDPDIFLIIQALLHFSPH